MYMLCAARMPSKKEGASLPREALTWRRNMAKPAAANTALMVTTASSSTSEKPPRTRRRARERHERINLVFNIAHLGPQKQKACTPELGRCRPRCTDVHARCRVGVKRKSFVRVGLDERG